METVAIPKKLEKELKDVSHNFGISQEDFLTNAVLYYLKTFKDKMDLKKELEMWARASEEDFLKFENSL